eukprot:scaffold93651_cov33-Phaeocystis_antarctica.AAC.1
MGTAPAVASDGALEALDKGARRQRCAKRVPPAPPHHASSCTACACAAQVLRRERWRARRPIERGC